MVLLVMKLAAGILGNSAAMVADAVHSLSDFLTDIVVGRLRTELDECQHHDVRQEIAERVNGIGHHSSRIAQDACR